MPDNNYQKTAIKQVNQRLDRFETAVMEKLDQLAEAMIKLARTEEKMMNYDAKFGYIEADLKKKETEIESLKVKITELDKNNTVTNTKTSLYAQVVERVFWVLLLGAASFLGANGKAFLEALATVLGG